MWQSIAWFYAFLPDGKELYMIVLAPVCWSIWTTRSKTNFDNYVMRSPFEIIFIVWSFLLYWSGLQTSDNKVQLAKGARKLIKLAEDLARGTQRRNDRPPNVTGN